ncbi:MAG: hypothetical protein K9K32_05895 [Halanaerobiales bacterium]|nr:hypothetical protein [Halanaerobiales bacterium]
MEGVKFDTEKLRKGLPVRWNDNRFGLIANVTENSITILAAVNGGMEFREVSYHISEINYLQLLGEWEINNIDEKERLRQAVNEFAKSMKKRLYKIADRGWKGWGDEENKDILANKLHHNCIKALKEYDKNGLNFTAKKEFIDIANLAMFLSRFCKVDDND